MGRSWACRSSCCNPPVIAKDELVGPAPTEGSDPYISALAALHDSTPAPPPALPFTSTFAIDWTVEYSKTDLQRIFRTVLEAKPLAFASQPLVFPDGPHKRPLKARFSELYCDKTHMEHYNFIQQYEEYFTIAGAKKPNRVPFASTFLCK